jgi:SAM-dependent methyltransferase
LNTPLLGAKTFEFMNIDNYYQSRFVYDKGRTKVWNAITEYLQYFLPDKAVVMDIGCGYADFINGIKAEKKYAIDLNEAGHKYISDENTDFTAQSVLKEFPVLDKSLDVVFASNLFEHFDDNELNELINNIQVKLRDKGLLILIQPNIYYAYKEYWDDYTHKKAFSHVSLTNFLEANDFEIVHYKKKFLPFSLKSRLPKSYWLTKIYLNSPIKPMGKQMLVIAKKK